MIIGCNSPEEELTARLCWNRSPPREQLLRVAILATTVSPSAVLMVAARHGLAESAPAVTARPCCNSSSAADPRAGGAASVTSLGAAAKFGADCPPFLGNR